MKMSYISRFLDRIPFAAVLLLVLLLPVTVYPPAHRYVIGQDVAAGVVVSVALLSIVARLIITGERTFRVSGIYVPLAAFLLLVALSLFRCRYSLMFGLEDAYRWYVLAVAFLLTFSYCRSGHRPVWIAGAWALSVVPAAIMEYRRSWHAIDEILGGWRTMWIGQRIGTTLGNVNIFGGYMAGTAMLLVPLIFYFVWNRRRASAAAGFILFLLAAAGTWFSYSIGARIGLLCAGMYLFMSWLPSARLRRRSAVVFCGLLVLGVMLLTLSRTGRSITESTRQGTFGARSFIYHGVTRMTVARPLLGSGPGSFVIEYPFFRDPAAFNHQYNAPVSWHAHSHLLETVAENGLPAALALCIFYAWCLSAGLGRDQEGAPAWTMVRAARVAAGSACCAMLGHGMGSIMLDGPLVPVFYLWIGLALAYPGRARKKTIRFGGGLSAGLCVLTALLTAGAILPINAARSEVHAKRAMFYQLCSAWETALYHYERALAIRPYQLTRATSRAVCLQNLGRHEEALDAFKAILRYAPLYGKTDYLMARSYRALGDTEAAWRALDRWVTINPYDDAGCAMLMDLCVETGRLDEARAVMEKAVESWPDDPLILGRAARVHMFSGEKEKGLRLFRRASELDDEEPQLKLNLALALLANNKTDEARRVVDEIVNDLVMDPTDSTLRRVYLKMHPEAPDEFESFSTQGITEGRDGLFEEAARSLYLAVLLRPEDAGPLHSLGACCYKHGRSLGRDEEEKARKLFRRAAVFFELSLRIRPDDVSTREALAYSLLNAADRAASLRVWRQIKDMNPENPRAEENIRKLRGMLVPDS